VISSALFFTIVLIVIFFIINLFLAHAIGIRGEKQGLRVEIIRIVLQTLTFTSGTLGLAPAYHGSVLLSDSRHGNYLTNKARSLISTTTLPPLIFSGSRMTAFFIFIFQELIYIYQSSLNSRFLIHTMSKIHYI